MTAHDRLMKWGFEVEGNGYFRQYTHAGRDMTIIFNTITKECGVFHLDNSTYRFFNSSLARTLAQYIEEEL